MFVCMYICVQSTYKLYIFMLNAYHGVCPLNIMPILFVF